MKSQASFRVAAIFFLGVMVGSILGYFWATSRDPEWADEQGLVTFGISEFTFATFARVSQEINGTTIQGRFLDKYPHLRHRGLKCYMRPISASGFDLSVSLREPGPRVPDALLREVAAWATESLERYAYEEIMKTNGEPSRPAEPSSSGAPEGR